PLPPGRDHLEVRREAAVRDLEADLVVALAGGAVGEGVGADPQRRPHLSVGQERPREGGAQEVLVLVHRARGQGLERVVAHELLAQVLDHAVRGAGGERLLAHRLEVVALAHVPAVGHDLGAAVVLLDPGDDDRRIESAGVGEDDLLHFHRFVVSFPAPVSSTASRAARSSRISPRRTTSGGSSRRTLSPAFVARIPRSRRPFSTGPASPLNSTPIMRPRPRTSAIASEYRRPSFLSPRWSAAPFFVTSSRKPGAVSRSSTTSDAAAATGFPPNVLPWSPAAIAPAISSRTSVAPMGSPPPSGLASVTMSGTTSACWKPNIRPVRPRPHCTASVTRSAPVSRHRVSSPFRKAGRTGRTPPSPWTGSIITAAVRGVIASFTAARSSQGRKRTPGTSGSKGSRYFGFQVVESAPIVRPWKARSKAMKSVRPSAFPIRRANFIAASQASVPQLQKNTLAGNASATS